MRNYCTIVVEDKVIGLRFGLPCLRQLAERKVDIGKVGDTYTELAIAHIIFAGYNNWCLVKDMEPEFVFDDFMDYVETKAADKDYEELIVIMTTFNESKAVKEAAKKNKKQEPAVEEPVDGEKKNQLTGTS